MVSLLIHVFRGSSIIRRNKRSTKYTNHTKAGSPLSADGVSGRRRTALLSQLVQDYSNDVCNENCAYDLCGKRYTTTNFDNWYDGKSDVNHCYDESGSASDFQPHWSSHSEGFHSKQRNRK